ncbi:anthranilate synthase component II [Thermodesulfobacteriota bacterium]
MKLLMVDNYDSFTYNLVQAFGKMGLEIEVFRNDAIRPEAIERKRPDRIVISPGPGTPQDSGISTDLVRRLGSATSILGVCLGMQCINEAYGGKTVHAEIPVHGKTSMVEHIGEGLFSGIPTPFRAARYHSLMVSGVPPELAVTARSDDGVVMALRHVDRPVIGVQFHPESFLTEWGRRILENFVRGVW